MVGQVVSIYDQYHQAVKGIITSICDGLLSIEGPDGEIFFRALDDVSVEERSQ